MLRSDGQLIYAKVKFFVVVYYVGYENDDEDDDIDDDTTYLRSGEVEAPRAESTSSMECGEDWGRGEEGEKEDDILAARCRGRQPSTSSS